jgi:hypothetical protein
LTNSGGTPGGYVESRNISPNSFPPGQQGTLWFDNLAANPAGGLYAQFKYNAPTGNVTFFLVLTVRKDGSGAELGRIQYSDKYTGLNSSSVTYRFPDDQANGTTADCVYEFFLPAEGGTISLPSGAIRRTSTPSRSCP